MTKAVKKTVEKATEKLGIEEKRETARAALENADRKVKELKERVAERQNRITVLEYLFSTLNTSNPIIEGYLMSMIELENDEIRDYDETIKKCRTNLSGYRQRIAAAEKTITTIIENGPNLQQEFPYDDADGKSTAGK